MLKRLYIFLIIIIACLPAAGQECEWLNVSSNFNGEMIGAVTADDSNNVIGVGFFANEITVDTITRTNPTNAPSGFVVKYTSDGVIKWLYKTMPINLLINKNLVSFFKVVTDDSNNIYTITTFLGHVDFGNGIVINDTNFTVVLLKLNTNGIPQ